MAEGVQQALNHARGALARGDAAGALQAVTFALQLLGRDTASVREEVRQALLAGSASSHTANQLAALFESVSLHCQSAQQEMPREQGAWQQQATAGQTYHISPGQQPASLATPTAAIAEGCPGDHGAEMDVDLGSIEAAVGSGNGSRTLAELVASAEGATYLCPHCGGAVSVARQQAHEQYWCPALNTG